MRERFIIFLIGLLGFNSLVKAQQAYFIDGYHGGVYGHYPMGQTSFIVQKLKQYPDWRVNLEIEPESWEVVRQRDPEGYSAFKQMFKDQSVRSGRIEYVNPTYAQSYFFGTSGVSVIRQFQYGMRLLRKHFPEAVFHHLFSRRTLLYKLLTYGLEVFRLFVCFDKESQYHVGRLCKCLWGGIGELGRTGRDETCYSTPLWLRRFTAGFDLAVHSLV